MAQSVQRRPFCLQNKPYPNKFQMRWQRLSNKVMASFRQVTVAQLQLSEKTFFCLQNKPYPNKFQMRWKLFHNQLMMNANGDETETETEAGSSVAGDESELEEDWLELSAPQGVSIHSDLREAFPPRRRPRRRPPTRRPHSLKDLPMIAKDAQLVSESVESTEVVVAADDNNEWDEFAEKAMLDWDRQAARHTTPAERPVEQSVPAAQFRFTGKITRKIKSRQCHGFITLKKDQLNALLQHFGTHDLDADIFWHFEDCRYQKPHTGDIITFIVELLPMGILQAKQVDLKNRDVWYYGKPTRRT